ncbi:hypothetical protein ACJMK2_020715 [Sinanodonta woodiana]|uniref:Ras-associating domain-containing protein n=1 Tax=Sinanodonta woodiana TaxID=1069815 RepID=A0ABD3U0Z7_SINWO
MHEISVLVEGRKRYMKVTKTTTCDDVIQYLLNANGLMENDKDYYFLIASNNRTEKTLSNNANILNETKDLMSETKRIHFIMRKKTPKLSISKCRRLRAKSLTKEHKFEKVPSTLLDTSKCAPSMKISEQIRVVKRLYKLVQVQKRRLSEVYQKCNGTAKFFKQAIRKKTIDSDADTSLDQFLKSVNKENMQGFLTFCDVVATKELDYLSSILPLVPTVERPVINGQLRFMPHVLENVANDVIMLDDELYHRVEGEKRLGTENLPSSQRRTIADPNRIGWDKEPLHSTPCANKTMSYLNKSIKLNRMERQFGISRLPLDLLTNRTAQEMPICASSFNRRPDGDRSMFICQRKFAFSSQKDKCKNFWEQSYGSHSDDNLDRTRLDIKHDDSVLNHIDDNRNVSLANEHDHLELNFDSNSREFPCENHQEDKEDDGSIKSNFKMRLVNYSDTGIGSMSCKRVEMSCDCKNTPCATFTHDYVTRFAFSPESA